MVYQKKIHNEKLIPDSKEGIVRDDTTYVPELLYMFHKTGI